jgi:hypothetical protein
VGGLNDKKQRILKEAAKILSVLAPRLDSAGKERKKVLDARGGSGSEGTRSHARKLCYVPVPGHVAFVATTSEYQIKNLLTLADLKDAIKENGVCDNPWIFPFCKLLT